MLFLKRGYKELWGMTRQNGDREAVEPLNALRFGEGSFYVHSLHSCQSIWSRLRQQLLTDNDANQQTNENSHLYFLQPNNRRVKKCFHAEVFTPIQSLLLGMYFQSLSPCPLAYNFQSPNRNVPSSPSSISQCLSGHGIRGSSNSVPIPQRERRWHFASVQPD